MRRAALVGVILLAGCGGQAARHDGPIVFRAGAGFGAVEPDGTHLRRVPVPGLASPDGRARLLPDGRLADHGRTTPLLRPADVADAAWSPDGGTIAYVHDWALWTVDVGSGVERRLTRPPRFAADGAPRWSPDGERLLFERGGDVWSVDAEGGGAFVLLRGARDARWSPDGRWIAFIEDAPNLVADLLVVADADGADLRSVSDMGAFTQFAWRPDGRALAYVSLAGALRALFVADAPEFEARPVLRDAVGGPAWSPSGRRVAVAAGSPPSIWVVDPGAGTHSRVTSARRGASVDPVWEPRR